MFPLLHHSPRLGFACKISIHPGIGLMELGDSTLRQWRLPLPPKAVVAASNCCCCHRLPSLFDRRRQPFPMSMTTATCFHRYHQPLPLPPMSTAAAAVACSLRQPPPPASPSATPAVTSSRSYRRSLSCCRPTWSTWVSRGHLGR